MAIDDIFRRVADSVFSNLPNQDDPQDYDNRRVRPASEDPYGDPADQDAYNQSGDQYGNVRPASEDPYGDPADQDPYSNRNVRRASNDPYGDPADDYRG